MFRKILFKNQGFFTRQFAGRKAMTLSFHLKPALACFAKTVKDYI